MPARLRVPAYRAFARATGADLGEAELELHAYGSLGDLFARRLRAGVRPIDPDPEALIAPCDGAIAAAGVAADGVLVQAKGHTYSLDELVVDRERAAELHGGAYVTIYLSPRDYHRVHAPLAGKLLGYDYVPGELWPVNPRVAARRDRLFARNERVVIWLHAPRVGTYAVVMIAAAGVGNIEVAGARSAAWRTAYERRRIELGGVPIERGGELGAFRLGSTVVLALPPGALAPESSALACVPGEAVRFGEKVGVLG
ncbi:MAG TPA: archaetidylserine decarboxylase [Kofleriaceae bacterium]